MSRIIDIEQEKDDKFDKKNKVQQVLDLISDFIIFRANYIEEKINSNFKNVKFNMFQYNVDGSLRGEHCEVMYLGLPYVALSRSQKIKAGIEVINGLYNKIDTLLPLIIDDAEAVTEFPNVSAQIIKLIKPYIETTNKEKLEQYSKINIEFKGE